MTRPVAVCSVLRFFTVTVASLASAGSVAGVTSKPAEAVRLMSVVRCSALTVKVCVWPVPLMTSSSAEVLSLAKAGA